MGKAFDTWQLELRRLAPSTRYAYVKDFNRFLEAVELTDDELFELRMESLRSEDPRDTRRIERMVSNFMFDQVQKGYAPQSAAGIGHAVTHFIRAQGLPFQLMKNETPKGESLGRRIVLKPQIKRMFEHASAMYRSRNRALIMLAKDCGLRISDMAMLDVDDYLDARSREVDGEIFKEFKPLTTIKTKAIAYVSIGPESIQAIDVYLEERGAIRGEPLFLDAEGSRLKVTAMSELFRRFGDMLEDPDRISAHSFRKYHETQMELAGIPLNWIKRYEGRKLTGSTGPYSNPQDIPGQLLDTYIEKYDALRVFQEAQELEELRAQVEEKGEEIADVKTEMAAQRAALDYLLEKERQRDK